MMSSFPFCLPPSASFKEKVGLVTALDPVEEALRSPTSQSVRGVESRFRIAPYLRPMIRATAIRKLSPRSAPKG